jgi:putative sterol carrier protein
VASLEEITARLREAAAANPHLGKTFKLDFKGEGCIFVDGDQVTNLDQPADCTFAMSKADFEDMARGRLDPAMAMMRGRLKVAGDLSLALRLRSMLERADG